jgi:hypothetical protein
MTAGPWRSGRGSLAKCCTAISPGCERLSSPEGAADALDSLGYIDHYQEALTQYRAIGNTHLARRRSRGEEAERGRQQLT